LWRNTAPTGQLTGVHHTKRFERLKEVKGFHFRAYNFPVDRALEWRMVSTTSVERPKLMRWALSESYHSPDRVGPS